MSHILLVDDTPSILDFIEQVLQQEGYRFTKMADSRKAREQIKKGPGFDLVISDLQMPGIDGLELLKIALTADPEVPFICMTGYASPGTAMKALKLGAFDYITKPLRAEELRHLVKNALATRNLKRKVERLENERMPDSPLVGTSSVMLDIYKLVGTVSATQSTVLILGESGTGKELVAQAIHETGPGKDQPFVSINCGVFPETLLESELFGHVKGAFTGAVASKRGLFELATGGTLLLDEVGEMSPAMQVKLLRSLQEKKIRRIGATEEISVDFRLIAATNRDLEKEIETGTFREDLYYRLAVITIHVPPLREREGDTVILVRHFIDKHNKRLNRRIQGISEEALACLEEYHWPGNVRELENVVERAVTLESGDLIRKETLPESVRHGGRRQEIATPRFSVSEGLDLNDWVEKAERQIIERALELSNGNQTRAAKILNLSPPAFRYRMEARKIRRK